MQAVPELNLDFYSDEVISAPHRHYAHMRALAPVVYLPKYDHYALTRYAPIQKALKEHKVLVLHKVLLVMRLAVNFCRTTQ